MKIPTFLFVTLFEKEVYHKIALAEMCSNPPSLFKMVHVVARLFNFRFTCRISEVHDVPRGPPVEGPSTGSTTTTTLLFLRMLTAVG